jgi:hypothetical protein
VEGSRTTIEFATRSAMMLAVDVSAVSVSVVALRKACIMETHFRSH